MRTLGNMRTGKIRLVNEIRKPIRAIPHAQLIPLRERVRARGEIHAREIADSEL